MGMLQDYQEKIVPKLQEEFGLKNKMAAPKIVKVVLNMGVGDLKDKKEEREKVAAQLSAIAGQRPQTRLARKAIAGFSLRRGEPVGLAVTLRGKRMYAFLEKLFGIVLPRLRDFRGTSRKSFDGSANFTLGIGEHTVFPEVDLAAVGKVRGLEITIVTNTKDPKLAERLLEELGMPFVKEDRG